MVKIFQRKPKEINIRVTSRTNPNEIGESKYMSRKILGMKHYLDRYQVSSGVVEVKGAKMHWWVVNDDFKKQIILQIWHIPGAFIRIGNF